MIIDWTSVVAIAGWILAIVQFALSHIENVKKNEAELLEKSLGYFERGTQARSIAIGLVDGIWFKKKKFIDVILPVLISQVNFLLTEADDYEQEQRNVIRLLDLIHKMLPHSSTGAIELGEISHALLSGAKSKKGVKLSTATLRLWFEKFNGGSGDYFSAETKNS
jgi:hypothetical protein